jgi:hypothetical protein
VRAVRRSKRSRDAMPPRIDGIKKEHDEFIKQEQPSPEV